MKTFIKRDLPNQNYEGAISANNPSSVNPYATIADLTSGVSGGNLLISGSAAWSGTDLDFDVTALEYLIAGVTYNTAPTTVTLAVGDPSNPRFDAIVADDTGTVSVITGTPAVTPITPSIGEDQVLVQYVLVGAGATTPTITTEYIYREGSPLTDWNPGTSCVFPDCPTADFASTTPAPFQGPQCTLIDFSTYSTGRYIKYDAPAPVVRSDYAVLTFRVWLFDDLTTIDGGLGRRPFVRLYANAGTTWLGTVYLDAWGLQRNVTNTWQLVSIPIAAFTGNTGVNQIDQFRIHCVESVANPAPVTQIAIDDVKLQSGYGPSVPSTQTFDVQDDGVTIAATTKINFVDTPTATVLVTDDTLNDRVNVEITAAGGGGAFGKVGIADSTGLYTYYTDLTTAMAGAVAGDTIEIFTDITESGLGVKLKDGVDLNLNGHTLLFNSATPSDYAVAFASDNCTINIFNGKIERTGGAAATARTEFVCFSDVQSNCNLFLSNVQLTSNQGLAYYNSAGTGNKIVGGIFNGRYSVDNENVASVTNISFTNSIFAGDNSTVTLGDSTFTKCIFGDNAIFFPVISEGGTFNNCYFSGTNAMQNGGGVAYVNNCTFKTTSNALEGSSFFVQNSSSNGGSFGIFVDSNIIINCSSHNATDALTITGDLNLINGCSIFSLTSAIRISAGDGIEITQSNFASVTNSIITIDSGFTGTGLKIQKCYGDSDNPINYFISAGSLKNAYVVDNTAHNVAGLTNNINNLQVNTADTFGNIITN
jgi:hypothetical protein